MTATIIDGREFAKGLRAQIATEVEKLSSPPGLAVVLVGEDPASAIYVRNKVKMCGKVGFNSFEHKLPADVDKDTLLSLINDLNANPEVNGILVQLPLPDHLDQDEILLAIDPSKDVDGLHPENVGRLHVGLPTLYPCTPWGCLKLIKSVCDDLKGKDALVIGASNLVGKPMAQMLLGEKATVTIAHSATKNLPDLCRRAEIVVVATGVAGLVKGDWIKPDAIVIDVGINRQEDGSIVGDVVFDDAKEVASAITPVPGGVGAMTIACLLLNTLVASCRAQGAQEPVL